MSPRYGDYQLEIYLNGMRGRLPRFPADAATMEQRAAEALPPWVLSYVKSGAGDEGTQRANVDAFAKWGLVPRMMAGAYERDLSTNLFGIDLEHPLFLCPIGVLGICSQDLHGDLATARAAAHTGVPMVASTLSQDPMEDIAAALGDTPGFFQLYPPNDRDLALSFIHRAEQAGFSALVVTLDTWVTGWRPRDLNTANFPQLRGYCLANYTTDEHFRARLGGDPDADPLATAATWASVFGHATTWSDLEWIREATSLPIVLKGISHPDDVRQAKDHGVDGIYCSNHGGRQANGGLPALQTLPRVVEAADGEVPVMFDSGIRSGSDMVKALAMGADAVGTGRPYVHALAVGGEDGVTHHLRSMLAEADLLMAIDGYPTLERLREAGVEPVL
ncbi:lactate 2-monooxygenase [Saccharomonospora sp. CUA-673]|uniref:alpha-hydroxy-acid oxidizing protein n=1 Tax=Saccharomonospora sp. CUA-673 TaxID=1904969 RepID=UPI000959D1FC|nr:alpha-hydroxy-acid oxidizing protein [Saccharomonospora sp. CUA-673]OLT41121.1 lactate 2-monooxygenase [Saccharomonospora sp. CUA-673]